MPELAEPADLHPELLAALVGGKAVNGAPVDVWACRECGAITQLVIVVPYNGAWKHAVHPLCANHYPAGVAQVWTNRWPGPATPTRGSRLMRLGRELTIAEAIVLARRATFDPHVFTAQRHDHNGSEQLNRWQARAVVVALGPQGPSYEHHWTNLAQAVDGLRDDEVASVKRRDDERTGSPLSGPSS